VHERYNTKYGWHFGYENSFIAAEKDNEFLKEWLDLLLDVYLKPFHETAKMFEECRINEFQRTVPSTQYFMPMDVLKCVLGFRQVSL
jgi:hypothetical protein